MEFFSYYPFNSDRLKNLAIISILLDKEDDSKNHAYGSSICMFLFNW